MLSFKKKVKHLKNISTKYAKINRNILKKTLVFSDIKSCESPRIMFSRYI